MNKWTLVSNSCTTHLVEAVLDGLRNSGEGRPLGGDIELVPLQPAFVDGDSSLRLVSVGLSGIYPVDQFQTTFSSFVEDSPMWSNPTDKAWSTLSVDCCPPPMVQVPNAMEGMVVPDKARNAHQRPIRATRRVEQE